MESNPFILYSCAAVTHDDVRYCLRRIMFALYIEILKRVDTTLHFGIDMWKRKLSFAGHVLRESGGDSHLLVFEGKINGKRGKG